MGRTGSGKSTLVDVITGLLKPDTGWVELNDVRLTEANAEDWQKRVGFVPQDPPMKHGTVLDNVCWLSGSRNTSRAWAALELAFVGDVVRALPDGIETSIGSRGTALSGGQRQRLALARALYRSPDVLILDESTSALDAETEAKVMRSLLSLPDRPTIIMISHRRNPVQGFGKVVVLEEGRIHHECRPDQIER